MTKVTKQFSEYLNSPLDKNRNCSLWQAINQQVCNVCFIALAAKSIKEDGRFHVSLFLKTFSIS